MPKATAYYAVKKGRDTGIFTSWADCQASITKYPNASYKKFASKSDAESFISGKPISTPISDVISNSSGDIDYFVYTDGACKNNGKNTASAGIGIYFGENDKRNTSTPLRYGKLTNNVAELTAIIRAYPLIKQDLYDGKQIAIVTDSEYSMKCISTYGDKCAKLNWNVSAPNIELVREVYELYKFSNVKFIHIEAHTQKQDIHSTGNANADKLASDACTQMDKITNNEDCEQNTFIYLKVPYERKEEIKKMGGRWNPLMKKWGISAKHPDKDLILSKFKI